MFRDYYSGKRALVTGDTGFKGSWLATWLTALGAEVTGYSAYLPSDPCNFVVSRLDRRIDHVDGDVRDLEALSAAFAAADPQVVFHLAAQPIVRVSYDDPKTTFDTNIGGTVNVLECIRRSSSVETAVLVTSDKCYDNVEWPWGYRETDRLGGEDPYSASKAGAEITARSYVQSFFTEDGHAARIATARAGNVIGGGDWAEARIVPDCVRSWSREDVVVLRNPRATRPWQHVLEPLSGYLWLAAALRDAPSLHGEPFNFGPVESTTQSVEELVAALAAHWPHARWRSDPGDDGKTESTLLKLSIDKARHLLAWRPALSLAETVSFTADWYLAHREAQDMFEFTLRQVDAYSEQAGCLGLEWAEDAAR